MIDKERALNRVLLARQSAIRKSRTASNNIPRFKLQQRTGKRRARRRVADPHFTRSNQAVSFLLHLPDKINACPHSGFCLTSRHCRAFCHIFRAICILQANRSRDILHHAHIHSKNIRLCSGSHQVHIGRSPCNRLCNQRCNLLTRLRDAFFNHAMIAAKYQHAARRQTDIRSLLNIRNSHDHLFQFAKRVERLSHMIPAILRQFSCVHTFSPSMRLTTAMISS